jgi:hypothetical protein
LHINYKIVEHHVHFKNSNWKSTCAKVKSKLLTVVFGGVSVTFGGVVSVEPIAQTDRTWTLSMHIEA